MSCARAGLMAIGIQQINAVFLLALQCHLVGAFHPLSFCRHHGPLLNYRTQIEKSTKANSGSDSSSDSSSSSSSSSSSNDGGEDTSKHDMVSMDKAMNRRFFLATATAVTTSVLSLGEINPVSASTSITTTVSSSASSTASSSRSAQIPWQASPVNKRSGVTVFDAEKEGYNVAFVTYLSRFLLNFDPNCQRYWFSGIKIPNTATASQVEEIRYNQFAAFSASVEVGLIGYEGRDGPKRLLHDLVRRYGTVKAAVVPENDERSSQERFAKSARRHIALLFSLLERNQPTQEITQLLASIDNASIAKLQLVNETQLVGYEIGKKPNVVFPPPQAGDDYRKAEGRAVLKSTGEILRFEVLRGGSGYSSNNPPVITVAPPTNGTPEMTATVQAKIVKGSLDSVRILEPGQGYSEMEEIQVTVASPDSDGEAAEVAAVVNAAVADIEITDGGSGYAAEKPIKVVLTPPEGTKPNKNSELLLVGLAYPTAKRTSFSSFQKEGDTEKLQEKQESFDKKYTLKKEDVTVGVVRGFESEAPPLPFWTRQSSSSAELLRLLPAGVGLEYDKPSKRYVLAMDTDYMRKYPAFLQQSSNRVIGTEFGPRGRAPIERDMALSASAYLRFCISGATCASLVHIALTPLDVAKTKLQTAPAKYPDIGTAIRLIAQEEGLLTFFTGWLPTLLGNFVTGGVLYVTTEVIRRSLSEAAGIDAIALEVPIILVAAAVASSIGAVLTCPFEAVRIRTVAQPDFAPNSIEVFQKMLKEEGIGSLLNAIPIFLVRNVPYAMTKFTVFGKSFYELRVEIDISFVFYMTNSISMVFFSAL